MLLYLGIVDNWNCEIYMTEKDGDAFINQLGSKDLMLPRPCGRRRG